MAEEEDYSQKTEEPTPRKLEEAFKKGKVVFSKEVTNFLTLVVFTLLLVWVYPYLLKFANAKLSHYIFNPHEIIIGDNSIQIAKLTKKIVLDLLLILAIPLLSIVAVVLFSSFIQHGFVLAPEVINFDLSRISIFKGLKRIFSLSSFVEFIKGILKLTIISIAIYITLRPEFAFFQSIHTLSFIGFLGISLKFITKMMIAICIIMGIIATLDFLYQRFEYMKNLKMTREEVKEELKQTEGNPEVKARLKSLRLERAKRRMIAAVPTADVVITNPTHYAIALKYESDKMPAPQVVAKGKDFLALKIKDVARENFIPVIENPALARALYDAADLDEYIPFEHYRAVAEVISYVMRLKGRKLL